ncbi:MAG: hypothetical protein AAGF99_00355 [Bacteroidota bacterium]
MTTTYDKAMTVPVRDAHRGSVDRVDDSYERGRAPVLRSVRGVAGWLSGHPHAALMRALVQKRPKDDYDGNALICVRHVSLGTCPWLVSLGERELLLAATVGLEVRDERWQARAPWVQCFVARDGWFLRGPGAAVYAMEFAASVQVRPLA